MTEVPIAELQARAIDALTQIARQTREVGAGTPSAHHESVDMAEVIVGTVTAVAANLGSAENLLSGRPGSWEAGHVRDIVTSACPDEELWRWRTEPVRVVVADDDLDHLDAAEYEVGRYATGVADGDLTDAQLGALEYQRAVLSACVGLARLQWRSTVVEAAAEILAARGWTGVDVLVTDDPRWLAGPGSDGVTLLRDDVLARAACPLTGALLAGPAGLPLAERTALAADKLRGILGSPATSTWIAAAVLSEATAGAGDQTMGMDL